VIRFLRFALLFAGIGVLAFAAGMLVVDLTMGVVVRKGDVVVVPELSGLDRGAAARALDANRLGLVVEREIFDAEADSGVIVRQLPIAGSKVKQGRKVSVTISKGPEWRSVPEVGGGRVRQARLTLAGAGLRVEEEAYVPHAEIARDLVIATSPVAGTPAVSGGGVRLLVSLGPEATGYLMPDLRGKALADVTRQLRLFQLSTPRVTYRAEAGAEPGTVLEQVPPAGAFIDRNTSLLVVVASA
jgi:serine/threonine-protein kinase